MFIAQKVASYSMWVADALRKPWARRNSRCSAEYKGFYEGMTANGFSERAVMGAVGHHPPVRRYVQQVARRRVRVGVPLDGLPEGQPSGRVHGRSADLRRRRQGQGRGVPGRPPSAGHHRCHRTSTNPCRTSPRSATTSASRARRHPQCRRQRRQFAGRHRTEKGVHRTSDYSTRSTSAPATRRSPSRWSRPAPSTRSLATRARACSWCTAMPSNPSWAPRRPRRWVSSTSSAARTTTARSRCSPSRFLRRSGDDKHKLALEREMLGLYVSGHPLNGIAHPLAAQVDTQIPAILDGDVANDAQVRVGASWRRSTAG